MRMTCRAVLWDLDGTLVDSEPAHVAALDRAVARLGLTLPDSFHDAMLGASSDAVHAALVAETGRALSYTEWRDLKWAEYRTMQAMIRPLPEAARIARHLVAAGIPCCVVSNSLRNEVELGLEAASLGALLPLRISREDVTRGKPDPMPYLTAADRLGIPIAECLVIEDSPTGAQAGVAAGARVVLRPQSVLAPAHWPDGVLHVPMAAPLWPAMASLLADPPALADPPFPEEATR
jgi:HAD superfamily hydrolase (TIGR01509 family)